MIKVNIMNVVVFPQSQFTVRMFPDMSLPVSSNCATAPWLPEEEAVGDFCYSVCIGVVV